MEKKYGENQTGTEPGTLIENSTFRTSHGSMRHARITQPKYVNISFSHNSKFYSYVLDKKMVVNKMNVLPIEKQFEIMDLIYQKLSTRVIARRANVSKSIVMDYKKRGPPIYRKYSKNSPDNPYPTTVQEEIKAARQKFQEIQLLNNKLIIERNTANRNADDLKKDNTWKNTEIGRLNYENKLKEIQLNHAFERFDELLSLAKNQNINIKKLKDEKVQQEDEIKNIGEKFQQSEKELVEANKLENFSKQTIHDLTVERDAYKDKAERIEKRHESDWMLHLLVAVISFIGGIVADQTVIPKIRNFILSWGDDHKINTADFADLTTPVNVFRPDIHYKYSGAKSVTIASSTFWSGAFFNPCGETYGYEPVPNHKDAMAHPEIYHIDNGVIRETNTSGVLYSGGYTPTQANNTGAEDTVFPNTQDGLLQSDIHGTSGEIILSTYTSGIIQTSGAVIFNHIQTPSVVIPLLVTPVPIELIDPYGRWIPIKKLNWKQSTPFLCWLFEQFGYKVTRLPHSHDKGGDILLEGYGEIIIIQVKHRIEHTGRSALQEVLYAKKMHGATKARVISFSSFTKEALNDAEENGIELWDLERLISEVRSHNVYYPVE